MSFINQADKARLAPGIKAVLKKYNAKGSIAVKDHRCLIVTVSESPFQIEEKYEQVNHYHIDRLYSGDLASFLNELRSAMMDGNYNNSDAQTDYFDVGWYIAINLGSWDKPHKTRQLATA